MFTINNYILALLATENKFSCVKAARTLKFVSHDHLTRCLNKNTFSPFAETKKLPSGGDLIFDDTVLSKRFSKKIEGTSYIYSPSDNKVLLGMCFVLVIYVYKNKTYILDTLMWQKGGLTRNELIRNTLNKLYIQGLKPKNVLFDSWYAASDTLNMLDSFQWKYFTLCRKNRKFNGKKLSEYKFYGAKGVIGKLKKVNHAVQIIKHGDRYVLTNSKISLNSRTAWKQYGKRWIIEIVFRDLKSNLHLDKCSSRSLNAQYAHILACLEAYLYLKKKYRNKSVQTARDQFLTKFRLQTIKHNKPFKLVA